MCHQRHKPLSNIYQNLCLCMCGTPSASSIISRPISEEQQQQQQHSEATEKALKQYGDSILSASPSALKCLIIGMPHRAASKWGHAWPISSATGEAFLWHLWWVNNAILICPPWQMIDWIYCRMPTRSILSKRPGWLHPTQMWVR